MNRIGEVLKELGRKRFEFEEKMLKKSTFESIGSIRAAVTEMTAG